MALARRPDFGGPLWRVVRLDALLGILITGLVYAIVPAPQVHLTGAALVATIGSTTSPRGRRPWPRGCSSAPSAP
ncbi:hypothetical protein GCM10027445_14250 [Amycolatopsis endophytica]